MRAMKKRTKASGQAWLGDEHVVGEKLLLLTMMDAVQLTENPPGVHMWHRVCARPCQAVQRQQQRHGPRGGVGGASGCVG